MPDQNNPLETVLRSLKDYLDIPPNKMWFVRTELINFRNKEEENKNGSASS